MNFKQIGSIMASFAMFGATMGLAAAAAYPNAFTSSGGSDVAIVVGRSAAQTDFVAATDVGNNLNAAIAANAASGGEVSTSGETYALFSGTRIYMNDSVNKVRASITSSNLPSILGDDEFNGNVDADVTHRIILGGNPIVTFAKQPTGDEDPQTGVALSTTVSNYLYNATVNFDQQVNFSNSDSEGEDLMLFGQKFTVASATTATKLVLLKSSQTLNLGIGGSNPNPSQQVTIDGKVYTVELIAASDTSATVRVTDSAGNSDSKEINEAASKKVQGLEVAVNLADESDALGSLSAEISVGSNKVTLEHNSEVKLGSDETSVDGTKVVFSNETIPSEKVDWITFQVAAGDSDEDAITPGNSFVDPIFGTFKVDFPGLNIADDGDERETIEVKNTGSDGMTVTFNDYNDNKLTNFQFVYNKTDSPGGGMQLASDRDELISVREMEAINESYFVVIGNEDDGGLYQVMDLANGTTGFSDDRLRLRDAFTGNEVTSYATSEGSGIVTLKGQDYTWTYNFANGGNDAASTVRINYPDSSGNNVVLFPTIETSKGASVAFYEPTTVIIDNYDGAGSTVSNFKLPDGDGYTDVAVANSVQGNFSIGGTMLGNSSIGAAVTVGRLTYNFTYAGRNTTQVFLQPTSGAHLTRPALILFEEQEDDSNNYNAVIIELDAGYDGDSAGVGISDVDRTWGSDGTWDDIRLESNDDLYQEMDLWGTIATVDKSDSDQATAVISYPEDQVYAQIYVSAADASVSAGNGGAGNIVPVYDNEASSISNKHLIVVGGSCVNTVAAELLGSSGPLCGPDFTSKTGIGAGEFLIQTFSRSGGKIATLVAGYNAADTTSGATALTTKKPEIAEGTKYKGNSAGNFALA